MFGNITRRRRSDWSGSPKFAIGSRSLGWWCAERSGSGSGLMIDSVRDKLQDIGGPDGCRSSGTGALDGEAPDEAFSADSIDLFPLQVGGHHLFVKHPSRPELVVKTFFPKEIRFYEAAQGIPSLLRVIAAYHGTISLPAFGGRGARF